MEEVIPEGERARQIRANKVRLRKEKRRILTVKELEQRIQACKEATLQAFREQSLWVQERKPIGEMKDSDIVPPEAVVRTFPSGATRDRDEEKLDPEAFLSPLVIECYCQFMHQCRVQADGTRRSGDNWQKGIPRSAYLKSGWRHFLDVWLLHRKHGSPALLKVALCALLFNVMGYLHELLIGRGEGT